MQPSHPARRYSSMLAAGIALALAGCGQTNRDSETSADEVIAPESPIPSPTAPSPAADAPGEREAGTALPDVGAAPLVPEAEKGEPGARKVLLDFARAIEFEDFSQAYAMLGDAARDRIGHAEFAAMFEDLGEITVAVPMGRMEGAAGSLYYEVPTTITGSKGGKLTGTTVLRRVNDVPGATAEQLRWHIESFTVEPG